MTRKAATAARTSAIAMLRTLYVMRLPHLGRTGRLAFLLSAGLPITLSPIADPAGEKGAAALRPARRRASRDERTAPPDRYSPLNVLDDVRFPEETTRPRMLIA